jgi:hypothetical protein
MLCAVPARGQEIDAQALLEKVRRLVLATVQQAPRYTCMEQVERYWYGNRKVARPGCDTDRPPEAVDRNLLRSDRLRLDVAVGAGQEMFSWHGEKSFRTEEIDELVTSGPISSGTYFSFLSSIFLEGRANIDFLGLRKEADKQLAVFGYAVPITRSAFETHTVNGTEAMGYRGEFLADAITGELEQLDIETEDMPKSAMVCSFNFKARYGTTVLGGNSFRLPTDVVMDVLDIGHEHTKTVTQYQQCHQFKGESVLRFDEAPAASVETPKAQHSKELPAGVRVDIRITSIIKPAAAWAGDPIEGELAKDILDGQRQTLARKGTVVSGRLLRIEHGRRPDSYTVALQFTQLSVADGEVAFNLTSSAELDGSRQSAMPRRIQLDSPPLSEQPGACRFRLSDARVKLKGVVTHWTTK